MASRVVYTPVSTTGDASPLLSDKRAFSDDESTDFKLLPRRRERFIFLHWIMHIASFVVIAVLVIRVWVSEPLQARCHKLFNYYCMIFNRRLFVTHGISLMLPQQRP